MRAMKSHEIGIIWLKVTGSIKPEVWFLKNPCKESKQNMPIKKKKPNQSRKQTVASYSLKNRERYVFLMECESPRKASITKQRQKIPQGFMIDKKQ